jgi:hypothetical protein
MSNSSIVSANAISAPKASGALLTLCRLSSDGAIYEPSCILCNHPKRKEAEEAWKQCNTGGSRDEAVVRFFNNAEGAPNMAVIRHHMKNHCNQAIDEELRKREYVQGLLTISSVEQGALTQIKTAISSLTERLATTGAIDPGSSSAIQSQKTKDVVAISKAIGNLVEIQNEIINEMAKRGEMIALPRERFTNLVYKAVQDAQTMQEKETILRLFEEMSKASEE